MTVISVPRIVPINENAAPTPLTLPWTPAILINLPIIVPTIEIIPPIIEPKALKTEPIAVIIALTAPVFANA